MVMLVFLQHERCSCLSYELWAEEPGSPGNGEQHEWRRCLWSKAGRDFLRWTVIFWSPLKSNSGKSMLTSLVHMCQKHKSLAYEMKRYHRHWDSLQEKNIYRNPWAQISPSHKFIILQKQYLKAIKSYNLLLPGGKAGDLQCQSERLSSRLRAGKSF